MSAVKQPSDEQADRHHARTDAYTMPMLTLVRRSIILQHAVANISANTVQTDIQTQAVCQVWTSDSVEQYSKYWPLLSLLTSCAS